MATILVRLETGTGVGPEKVPPLPSCPYEPQPHALTVPSPSNARLWPQPAATAIAPLTPATCTGVLTDGEVVPVSPLVLRPHAHTVPFVVSASVWLHPTEMAFTGV